MKYCNNPLVNIHHVTAYITVEFRNVMADHSRVMFRLQALCAIERHYL